MTDERCPKCGAKAESKYGPHFACGSMRGSQSDACKIAERDRRIAELEAENARLLRESIQDFNETEEQLAAARADHARICCGLKRVLGLEHWPDLPGNFQDAVVSLVEQQLAAANETCRQWERLCACAWPDDTGLVVIAQIDGEDYWIDCDDGKWVAGRGDDCDYICEPKDSPLDALAAIEAWEAEQKGAGT